jgi:GTP:adenosylcobinamide-phosphate guanylyltransferase
MGSVVVYNQRTTDSSSSGGSGGNVEDILKRLGNVETDVSELKSKVSAILATVPHLATKADLSALEASIIKWIIATVLTAAGLAFAAAKFVH